MKLQDHLTSHLSPVHLYDASNRLLEDAQFTYAYDLNGNLLSKTERGTGLTTSYAYDSENQLIRIDLPGSVARYRYDALGRRIEKDLNGALTRSVYDSEDILLEFNGANRLTAPFTHGPGIDEPLQMARDLNLNGAFEAAERFSYHPDGLGSITDLTDSTGTLTQSYVYDSFGNIAQQIGTLPNPYTFTSREFDPESGFYYFRARYYDPRIGRFLSQDPIGSIDRPNLYAYVENNPLILADPYGLWSVVYNGGAHIAYSPGVAVGVNVGSELVNPLSPTGTLIGRGFIPEVVFGEFFDIGISAGIGDISNSGGRLAGDTISFNIPFSGKYGGVQVTLRKDFNWNDPKTWIPDTVQVGLGVGAALPVTYTTDLELSMNHRARPNGMDGRKLCQRRG